MSKSHAETPKSSRKLKNVKLNTNCYVMSSVMNLESNFSAILFITRSIGSVSTTVAPTPHAWAAYGCRFKYVSGSEAWVYWRFCWHICGIRHSFRKNVKDSSISDKALQARGCATRRRLQHPLKPPYPDVWSAYGGCPEEIARKK